MSVKRGKGIGQFCSYCRVGYFQNNNNNNNNNNSNNNNNNNINVIPNKNLLSFLFINKNSKLVNCHWNLL